MFLMMILVLIFCNCFFQKKSENFEGGEGKEKEYEDKGRELVEKILDGFKRRVSFVLVEEAFRSISRVVLFREISCQLFIISMVVFVEVGEEVLTIEVKEKVK